MTLSSRVTAKILISLFSKFIMVVIITTMVCNAELRTDMETLEVTQGKRETPALMAHAPVALVMEVALRA